MKLKKTTWILVGITFILGSAIALNEWEFAPKREELQEQQKQLFNFTEEAIQVIKIEVGEQNIQIKRAKDKDYTWQMEKPEKVPAEDGIVAFLSDLLVDGESESTLDIENRELKEYGLDKPFATIEVELEEGKKHQIILGNLDFSEKLVYALKDYDEEKKAEAKLLLVPLNFKNAVDRDLAEWKRKEEKEDQEETSSESEGENPLEDSTSNPEEKENE